MNIQILDRNQIIEVYYSKMIHDFPQDELRPLDRILGPYDEGTYICYGLFDEACDCGDILGYACFVKRQNNYLFDYLAVSEASRNSGLGTEFLRLIKNMLIDSDSVVGEVEDPEYAVNSEEKRIQERRLGFYLRNGYINTGVKVKLFGVDYIVLELDLGKNHDRQTVEKLYQEHYRSMLPESLYLSKVIIK